MAGSLKSCFSPLLAPIVCLLIPVFANSQAANPCDAILKYGIFDVSSTSNEENLTESYLSMLESHNVGSIQEAEKVGASFGAILPVEGVPVEFRAGGDSSKWSSRNWAIGLREFLNKESGRQVKFRQEFKKANGGIIQAWSDCVKHRNNDVFVAWVEATPNPNDVLLKIEYRPTAGQPASLRVQSVREQHGVLDPKHLEAIQKSDIPQNTTQQWLIRRIKDEPATTVEIKTTNPAFQTSFDLMAIPKPLPEPRDVVHARGRVPENFFDIRKNMPNDVEHSRVVGLNFDEIESFPANLIHAGQGNWSFSAPNDGEYIVDAFVYYQNQLFPGSNDSRDSYSTLYAVQTNATGERKDYELGRVPDGPKGVGKISAKGHRIKLNAGDKLQLQLFGNANATKVEIVHGSFISIRKVQ